MAGRKGKEEADGSAYPSGLAKWALQDGVAGLNDVAGFHAGNLKRDSRIACYAENILERYF